MRPKTPVVVLIKEYFLSLITDFVVFVVFPILKRIVLFFELPVAEIFPLNSSEKPQIEDSLKRTVANFFKNNFKDKNNFL